MNSIMQNLFIIYSIGNIWRTRVRGNEHAKYVKEKDLAWWTIRASWKMLEIRFFSTYKMILFTFPV